MEILDIDATAGRRIDRFGSIGARHLPLAHLTGDGATSVIRLDAAGVLGRHPAVIDQLFVVIAGSGWVSGPDTARTVIEAGQAVVWRAGEEHESGTAGGMTALVIEVRSITTP